MTDDEDQRRIGALCLELKRVERERDEARAKCEQLRQAIHRLHEYARGELDGSESEIADVINAALEDTPSEAQAFGMDLYSGCKP